MCNAGYELQYENTFPVIVHKRVTEKGHDSKTAHATELFICSLFTYLFVISTLTYELNRTTFELFRTS